MSSDVVFLRVVRSNRNAGAALLGDQRGGFFDRLGPARRRGVRTRAAAHAIYRRAFGPQPTRNAAPGTARCTGNDGDLAGKLHLTVMAMGFDRTGGACGMCR
jgi:hypothetical protein